MADPKYANLPGIAYDQPDVYETSDLPEVDQSSFDIGDESESVERVNINANDSFNKFKGKHLDSSKTDFSDRLSQNKRIGYNVLSGEYEMVGVGECETPQQKYQRLQLELRELVEEVSQIKETVNAEKTSDKNSMVLTAKQVETLEKQLLDMRLEQVLGSEVIANLSDPQGALQKKLLTEVEKFKKSGTTPAPDTKKKDSSKKDEGGDQMVYELHYKPEQTKFLQSAKVAEFEQRVQKIEQIIGNYPEKMSTLAADTNQKHLMAMVSVLTAKVSLLDPEQLDQIEGRLQIFSQKLQQIADKSSTEEADKQSKVSEMYDLVKKMESLSVTLPDVVERIMALKDLHEQALQFSKALTQLDVVQQQIQASLQDNQKLLKDVQGNFSKNMDVIKSNVSNLDGRLSKLKK